MGTMWGEGEGTIMVAWYVGPRSAGYMRKANRKNKRYEYAPTRGIK